MIDPEIRSAYFSFEMPDRTDQNLLRRALRRKQIRTFLKNLFIVNC